MREIPSLQTLCLRSVGSLKCSTEVTFAPTATPGSNGQSLPSPASRLLRSFHRRPTVAGETKDTGSHNNENSSTPASSLDCIPMTRTPCIGTNSARRIQTNDVDLNLPFVACRLYPLTDNNNSDKNNNNTLVVEYANPALDCLQSIIDALVELGRMDDTRLGKHFFAEWTANVQLAAQQKQDSSSNTSSAAPPTKRRRTSESGSTTATTASSKGGLSLYNCTLSADMMEAMLASNMGAHLAVLDMTGVHGLDDDLLATLLPTAPHMIRLSLKNCRRVTVQSLRTVAQYQPLLQALDIGGAFNISAEDVLEVLPAMTQLTELHASGLGWSDATIDTLMGTEDNPRSWNKLSLGFSFHLSASALRQSLRKVASTLQSLALPFCETCVDNALLGMLGRNLPAVQYLDVRGNHSVSTLTAWYDGRASANLPAQPLLVLGRFSGLSEASVEETRRVHPTEAVMLTVILDAMGAGSGITRTVQQTASS